ncbi:PepSY domain-containing protein [Marinobacterium sp. MBR-109]|jgi:uncharacterized membrane protein YkoI|uniref:PepSY domain-containing protein n=1 Tax=Marinobacterium sp. MBR-109 TaxID=3156462 RepID=UPI0033969479
MKSLLAILLSGFMALTMVLSPAALASRDVDQDEARRLMLSGQIRPLSELMLLHPERLSGHLLDVELEEEDGRLVYEIEVLGKDGVVREFYLDASSGAVIKEEIED